jgi:hypothetical protein
MIKPSRSTATDSRTLSQSLVSYTPLTFFLYLGAVLSITLVSTCSGHWHRSRRLGPLSKDGLGIRGQPPSREGHRVQFEVCSPFVFSLSVCFALALIAALRLRVLSRSATIASLRRNRCPHARYRHSFSFHLTSPFHWTTVPISRP